MTKLIYIYIYITAKINKKLEGRPMEIGGTNFRKVGLGSMSEANMIHMIHGLDVCTNSVFLIFSH